MIGNLIPTVLSSTLPPEYIVWNSRILADNGTIRNSALGKATINYYKSNGRLSNLKLLVLPEAGAVIRDASPYKFVTKLNSADVVPNNVAQGTAGSQPYLSGFIAPNEKYAILNPNGGTKLMSHNSIAYVSADSWTVSVILNPNLQTGSIDFAGGNTSGLYVRVSTLFRITVIDNSGTSYTFTSSNAYSLIGKNSLLTFTYSPNNLSLYINGVFIQTLNVSFDITFSKLGVGRSGGYHAGKIYFYSIESVAISASQCLSDFNFWRSYIPEIETVTIGTQQWATSNLDIVTTPMGTAIPEVTDNAAWAALTTPAWCHYNNDSANGALYGKLYNWYAVKQIQDDITVYNAANPTKPWGYHIPTQAEFTTLQTFLGGASVAGGKLKATGTTHWSSPNTGATNESGFTGLGSGYRLNTGTYTSVKNNGIWWSITEYYRAYCSSSDTVLVFSNVSEPKLGFAVRLIKD